MDFYVKRINATETHRLRATELGWLEAYSSTSLPEDEHETTLHLGAFLSDAKTEKLVGILTTLYNKLDYDTNVLINNYDCDKFHWQIRGMAVENSYKNNHVGSLLLAELQKILIKAEANLGLWANARANVLLFYQKNGFSVLGNKFHITGIGDHYKIVKAIQRP